MKKIETDFTRMFGIDLPLIVAPMFLVSNEDLVVNSSMAGALGTFPALNYRPIESYRQALKNIRARTVKPIGVNIIVNKSNTRQTQDLQLALEAGVNLFITSLGNPKEVIHQAHQNGAKVFCDVTNLEHGLKVEDLGADGVIAVASGAGGHAGPISPLVLVPWLKERLQVPIVLAGGIANGAQMAAALALGASAVSVGTRFIATTEASVDQPYKEAVVKATPEDIMMTSRISGTPAAIIRTPYVEKWGGELPWIMRVLKNNPSTKKWMVPLIHWMGMKKLESAAVGGSWKSVWSAGQSAGLVHDILPAQEIIRRFAQEYEDTLRSLPNA